MKDLTAFQRDLLYAIASLNNPYGLGIKEKLESYYDEDVNTGRVYQNLGKLVDTDYVEKAAIDKRTNSYTLTAKATTAIDARHAWERNQVRQIDVGDPASPPETEPHP